MEDPKYKIVNNIVYTPDNDTISEPRGIGYYYYNQMIKHKDKIAQIDGNTKQEDTFGDLLQRSVRTALTMIDKGIKPGDHISLCSHHHFDTGTPFFASYFIGAIMGAIDTTMSVNEATNLLRQTMPKMLFVMPEVVPLVEKCIENLGIKSEIIVFGETTQHTPFSEFLQAHKNETLFCPRPVKNLDEIAFIAFSSGTTGLPKGICHTHRTMLSNCLDKFNEDKLTVSCISASAYWSVFPLSLHHSAHFGSARVIYPFFDINEPWTMFYQKVDVAFLNSLYLLRMVRSNKPEKANLENVKLLLLGANYVTPNQADEIKSCLPKTKILPGYSQTEFFGVILSFPLIPLGDTLLMKHPNSVGTVVKGVSYKIVDVETGKLLGPNQVGELQIKSPAQMIGYYNRDSSECFDSDGWLKTGDLFYYNEDMCFFIVGRIKESFKYYNLHISPVEIEEIILQLESIETAIVIGRPHETESNHPMAIVKLKPNAKEVSAEEIIKHVEENLEDHKRLRGGVVFVDHIPMTVTGKVNRFKLKEILFNKQI